VVVLGMELLGIVVYSPEEGILLVHVYMNLDSVWLLV
jgi:hypothetical protein